MDGGSAAMLAVAGLFVVWMLVGWRRDAPCPRAQYVGGGSSGSTATFYFYGSMIVRPSDRDATYYIVDYNAIQFSRNMTVNVHVERYRYVNGTSVGKTHYLDGRTGWSGWWGMTDDMWQDITTTLLRMSPEEFNELNSLWRGALGRYEDLPYIKSNIRSPPRYLFSME